MRTFIESLRRYHFFSLLSGVVISNALSLLSMPILTRVYPVEGFGIFAVFWALSTIIGLFSTLRLEVAIPAVKDAAEVLGLAQIAWLFSLIVSSIFLLLWCLTPIHLLVSTVPSGIMFGACVAVGAVINAQIQVQNQWAIQLGNLKSLSIRNIFEKLVTIAASIGFASWDLYGLIWAQLLGILASSLYMLYSNGSFSSLKISIPNSHTVALLKKYRDFPSQNGPATIFQILSAQLPPLIYSSLFSVEALGLYNLAQRLTEAPNAILNSALSVVYYRRMLSAEKSDMKRIFLLTLRILGLTMIVPTILVCIFAQPLMAKAFGAAWEHSGMFLMILMPLMFFRMLYIAGQSLFLVLRELKQDLLVSAAIFAASLSGLIGGYFILGTFEGTVAGSSLLTVLAYIFGIFLIYKNVARLASAPNKI